MLHTAIKNLIAHRLRLMATALAVILGVALMAGTLVLTATMQRTFDNLFADVYRGTDAVVRAQSTFEGLQNVDTAAQRGRVDASLMTSVQAVSGVAAADGSISGYARPIGSDGKALGNPATGGPNLGINWSDNPKLNTFTLVTGSATPPRCWSRARRSEWSSRGSRASAALTRRAEPQSSRSARPSPNA